MRVKFMAAAGFITTISVPNLAVAHTGNGSVAGLFHGLAHPVSGPDHFLAMVLVGIVASQLGGRALWLVPASFLAAMALGGGLGIAEMELTLVEMGIALSVVVLGAAVALNARVPVAIAMQLVGLFAIFHGYAHGAEMPENAAGLAYGAGFMLATALLHMLGLAAGSLVAGGGERRGMIMVRTAGGLAALTGVGLMFGVS